VLPHPLDPNMHTDPLEALAHNATGHVLYVPSQQEPSGLRAYPGISLPFPVIIYPGSFNPLHEVSHSSHAVHRYIHCPTSTCSLAQGENRAAGFPYIDTCNLLAGA
jgi:hypothetical protein